MILFGRQRTRKKISLTGNGFLGSNKVILNTYQSHQCISLPKMAFVVNIYIDSDKVIYDSNQSEE